MLHVNLHILTRENQSLIGYDGLLHLVASVGLQLELREAVLHGLIDNLSQILRVVKAVVSNLYCCIEPARITNLSSLLLADTQREVTSSRIINKCNLTFNIGSNGHIRSLSCCRSTNVLKGLVVSSPLERVILYQPVRCFVVRSVVQTSNKLILLTRVNKDIVQYGEVEEILVVLTKLVNSARLRYIIECVVCQCERLLLSTTLRKLSTTLSLEEATIAIP